MERLRKPFEGVGNIVRFNWPFYAAAVGAMLGLIAVARGSAAPLASAGAYTLLYLLAGTTLISLLVSAYVYDWSTLYTLSWLKTSPPAPGGVVVNIHAGFDETSSLLRRFFTGSVLTVFDFYDPAQHTEASIRRARAAYPAFPGTQPVATRCLPLPAASANWVFIWLAAHEIREPEERLTFLREVGRIAAPAGRVVVVEHLRDTANFLAYTIGFFHFYSRRTWQQAFQAAGLRLEEEKKITPFISAFILYPDGNAS